MTGPEPRQTTPPSPPRRPRFQRKPFEMQLLEAKERLEAAKAEYARLAEQARRDLGLGKRSVDQAEVLITPNRQWQKDKAYASWGNQICTMQVDQVQAKAVMTGEQYNSYYTDGPYRVVVTRIQP